MNFDYHVMWKDHVVDRATTERVAVRVCVDREEILARAFRMRTLSILHVPSGTVVARHHPTRGFLPLLARRGNSKLTGEAVLAIRQRRAAGEKGRDLAEEFGVSESAICHVVRGRTWTAV